MDAITKYAKQITAGITGTVALALLTLRIGIVCDAFKNFPTAQNTCAGAFNFFNIINSLPNLTPYIAIVGGVLALAYYLDQQNPSRFGSGME